MARDVDLLRPFAQGQAETTALLLRAIAGALQPQQVFQSHADAMVIQFRAMTVARGAREGEGVIQALEGAGHLHGRLSGRMAIDVPVVAPVDDAVMHPEHEIRNLSFEL